ncbi:hypothetical protein [Microbacterium sp. G2-8]|uniref:hypothetical protein n=1 Tax=Microbacterium sp. G2-8 TaxID=2842454 RepID=UPI001C89FD2F|nr:hypothetical protein [Microbacterium sp. G2-8]
MEIAGLILGTIGAVDLVRAARGPSPSSRRASLIGIIAILLSSAAVGVALQGFTVSGVVLALIAPAFALLWAATMHDDDARAGFVPVLLVGVAVAVSAVIIPTRSDTIELAAGSVPLPLVVLCVGSGLFLVQSSNLIVRTALRREAVDLPDDPPRGRWLWPFASRPADPPADVAPPRPTLRGGRMIGPLERLLIAGLVIAQGYHLIAALVAAKGIVRFPEISRDRDRGTMAEYFLVGSMVSWALSLAVALLIWFGFETYAV